MTSQANSSATLGTGAHAEASGALSAYGGEPVRLLRRLNLPVGRLAQPIGRTTVIVVVDVETTGLDFDEDVIVELALRRIRIDEKGSVVEIGQGRSWLEDPGRPLDLKIARLTGLTDSELQGRHIDAAVATKMLRSADWVCAHNGKFDRRFVERRLPDAAGSRWCCSCVDIDWGARGFDGRGLGWLLSQTGLCHGGHRALNDVDAVVALLASEHDGSTAVAEMLATASRPAWIVSAVGASFGVKDTLRRRGYKWNPSLRLWQREIADRDRTEEEFWLARSIYSDDACPQALGPQFDQLDPSTRFL